VGCCALEWDVYSKWPHWISQHINIRYMTKRLWTPAHRRSHSKMMGINMELVPPLLLQQSPVFPNDFPPDVRTLLPFSHKIISEVSTDVGLLGLACSRHSNSFQRCSMGLQASQVLPHRSRQTTSFCEQYCHALSTLSC
jgi:hypothetical protein